MKVTLLTSQWPHTKVSEFLDEEINYLSRAFDEVVVVPMRPSGSLTATLPGNTSVDYSLAEHLISFGPFRKLMSRKTAVAIRSVTPNRHEFGATLDEVRSDGLKLNWVKSLALARADFKSVQGWATGIDAPDVAYTFWLGSSAAALRIAWPEVPIVSRVHGGDLYSEANGWKSIPFQSDSIKAVNLLASVSDDGKEYLASKFPANQSKIVTRRLGIADLGACSEPTEVNARIHILSASSITPVKRVDLILEAMRALAQSGMRVNWTHLGDGPERGVVERALSTETSDQLQVDLRGHVPPEEVRREMVSGKYNLFVNLSLSEGAPVSLMEAQCVGMPVVATDVGGTREVVPTAFNELVPSNAGPVEVSAAIRRAIARSPKEGIQRRGHWSTFYDSHSNYRSWADEIHELALRNRPQ